MRAPRIKEVGPGYYHLISRVVDRRMILDDSEKERFCRIMRAVEGFSGCQVLTYAVLSNHFHIALYVPQRTDVSDGDLLRRLNFLYSREAVGRIAKELQALRAAGDTEAAEAIRRPYLARMHDLSEFAKDLKQRVSQSYNSRHQRRGTLWEERFKSILLEGKPGTLTAVAAYIELNAVRAGLVDDPKDYRFCGYAEAVAGSMRAKFGICRVMASLGKLPTWTDATAAYRKLVYATGAPRGVDEEGRLIRRGFSAAEVAAVEQAAGTLPAAVLLHCRVRYFTDGAILGSRRFVNDAFTRHRAHFGTKRQTGARPMRGQWSGLCTARRLRLNVITLPQVC